MQARVASLTYEEELQAFCESNYRRLVGALSLYCGNALTAEDAAQDALLKLCRNWGRVRRMESPEGWLYKVGINTVRSMQRRRSTERTATARLASREPETGVRIDAGDLLVVREAVSSLPPRQKTVVILRFYLDLSVLQAAELMGCSEGTVKSLTNRAKKSLVPLLGAFDD